MPPADRLDPDHPRYDDILAAHARSIEMDTFGYRDPGTGLFVLSAKYLWDRGYCCEARCRHCPFVGRAGAEDLVTRRRV